jgi:sugar O-acyltransferase (sialic acid O-acetyltransferase NeuD family)
MTKRLILVGCGAFARELINWAQDVAETGQGQAVTGFLDEDAQALTGFNYKIEYLGKIDAFVPQSGDYLLMAIGDPSIKKKIYQELKAKGAQFAQLIHPSAVIARSAKLGDGVVVCPQAFISADAIVGDMVAVNGCASVGHDVRLGSFCTLSSHVDLTGWVQVEECVFFGSGAKVLPKVKVRAGAKIGAGAVVMRSVAENAVMYAQPAKKL